MTSIATRPRHNRGALFRALESAGFLVFEVTYRGRDRERLREFWATLILLDLPMPRMGGLVVFRPLRGAGEDTPEAIVLTHGRVPEATTVIRLGLLDVLARPLAPAVMHSAVEEILCPAAGALPGSDRPRILVAVEPLILELLRAKRALDRREFDAAGRLLRRAIHLDPDSAVAHNLMGMLHQRLGEHRAAYRSFKAALRADPHYEPALENLRRECNRLGLEFPDSCQRLMPRNEQPGPIGRSNEKFGPSRRELSELYDRSHNCLELGLDSGVEPDHGPTRKRGR